MKLIFIRHGETEVNKSGSTHRTDDEAGLTSKGKKQILDNLELLQSNEVQRIYCSPEKRAIQSAQILSEKLNLKLIILEELRERNWGEWEGKTWEWIKEKLDKMNLEERYTFIPLSGESWKQMEQRLKKALNKITSAKGHSSEDSPLEAVAVVTHGGAMRGLMPILKNSPKEESFKYDFKNGEAVIIEIDSGYPRSKVGIPE